MKRKSSATRWKRLHTEAANPRSLRLDRLGVARTVSLMQREDRNVLRALRGAAPDIVAAAEAFRETFLSGGRCFLFGAGTSGRLAVLEAAELPPTFGTPPRRVRAVIAGGRGAVFRAREGAEDDSADGRRRAMTLRAGDLAIGVSASSVTPFVRGALESARAGGARTVLVTASGPTNRERIADVVVRLDVGPEVIAGSTRLKAGTATKLALNQITTAALASAGKVYGPWMVDMRAGSAKLKDRARRIVSSAARIADARAVRVLRAAGGDVKAAIVIARTGSTPADARRTLRIAGGDLRRALEIAGDSRRADATPPGRAGLRRAGGGTGTRRGRAG